MDQQNNHQNGNSNGFLAGVLVGVVITLLFTTKKGREIFKETVDRAVDKFNDLQTKVEEKIDEEIEFEDEEEDGSDYIKPEAAPKEPVKEVRYLANEEKAAHVEGSSEPKEEKTAPVAEKTHQQAELGKEEVMPEAPKKSSPIRKFFKIKKS